MTFRYLCRSSKSQVRYYKLDKSGTYVKNPNHDILNNFSIFFTNLSIIFTQIINNR